jgi:hypothetical protein
MNKRGIGILLGLSVLAGVLSLYTDYRFDQRLAHDRAALVAMEREFMAMETTIASIRAAQAGYTAAGQVPASWMSRADADLARLESRMTARRALAVADSASRWEQAAQALAALKNADGSARAWVERGDRAQAADTVFVDGAGAADRLVAQLNAIHALEADAGTARTGTTGLMRLGANAAGLLVAIGIAAWLARALVAAAPKRTPSTAEMIRDLPPPVKNAVTAPAQPPGPLPAAAPAPVQAQAPSQPAVPALSGGLLQKPVAWSATAELCVDLARLLDGRDVPALLERAASLLDAKGIMIWSADADKSHLMPSLCQGYGENVLRRLRPLQADDDNITSLAFRTMQPQTMPGATLGDSAAIAVPLITPAGCVGVLAAEVRQSRPHPDVVPLARIIAAQFSTLVGPQDAALPRAADA